MTRKQLWLWTGLVPLVLARPVAGQAARDMVAQAVQAYTQALDTQEHAPRLDRFRRAQRLFAQVIQEQGIQNTGLYMGLGNAAMQCRQLGAAVLAYRRVLVVDPAHAGARQNIAYARKMLPDWVPRPASQTPWDTFFVWHRLLSRSAQWLIASLCFAAMAVAGAVAIRWRQGWAKALAMLLGSVWLVLVGLLVWQTGLGPVANQAVVTADEAVARAADSDGAPARFANPLPGGTEVTVVSRRDDWLQIRLSNGLDGWVKASHVTPVVGNTGSHEPNS